MKELINENRGDREGETNLKIGSNSSMDIRLKIYLSQIFKYRNVCEVKSLVHIE
jgi:hypothetical protein